MIHSLMMSLRNELAGPPPALFHHIIGPPPPDCFVMASAIGPSLPANESQLRDASPLFAALVNTIEFKEKRVIQLDLKTPNADIALRKAMAYISTGELNMEGCSIQQLKSVADECQIAALQEQFQLSLPKPQPKPASIFPFPTPSTVPASFPVVPLIPNPFLSQINAMQNIMHNLNFLQLMTQFHMLAQPTEVADEKVSKKRKAPTDGREMKKSHSVECDEPFDNMGDAIIPSTENEGWCRNKKYIEKTEGGFMCTVCRKVYGRYNSVSYHVTIYHRNPPIKCDMQGCQFTTREARYIHFHKYYRHGIALPQSIDQGSRRCPYCRHVSKSPAMLEKHIKRHQTTDHVTNKQETSEVGSSSEFLVVDDIPMEEMQHRNRTLSQSTASSVDSSIEEEVTKPRAFTM